MLRIFILETISLWVVFIIVLHTWNIDLLIYQTILVHHPTWRDLSPFSLFPSDSQFLGSSDPSEIDIYCIISSSILSSTSVRPKARVVKTQEPGKLLSTYRGPRSSWLVHELSTPSDFTIWIRTSSAPCSPVTVGSGISVWLLCLVMALPNATWCRIRTEEND